MLVSFQIAFRKSLFDDTFRSYTTYWFQFYPQFFGYFFVALEPRQFLYLRLISGFNYYRVAKKQVLLGEVVHGFINSVSQEIIYFS